jgi:hypothetical protein
MNKLLTRVVALSCFCVYSATISAQEVFCATLAFGFTPKQDRIDHSIQRRFEPLRCCVRSGGFSCWRNDHRGRCTGTGVTIVSYTLGGQQSLFATSPLIGLTTAPGVFSRRFVIVGNVPVSQLYAAGTGLASNFRSQRKSGHNA